MNMDHGSWCDNNGFVAFLPACFECLRVRFDESNSRKKEILSRHRVFEIPVFHTQHVLIHRFCAQMDIERRMKDDMTGMTDISISHDHVI